MIIIIVETLATIKKNIFVNSNSEKNKTVNIFVAKVLNTKNFIGHQAFVGRSPSSLRTEIAQLAK